MHTLTGLSGLSGIIYSGPINQAPSVNAGLDDSITLPASATLVGSATDDGLPVPPGALTYLWTQRTGPGTATFLDATDPTTTVSFSMAGTYVLRLTADDGTLTSWDEVTITVSPSPYTVRDRFTDTNGVLLQDHTPNIDENYPGGAWLRDASIVTGHVDIQSNTASPVSAAASVYSKDAGTDIPKVTLSANIVPEANNFVYLRFQDINNNWFCQIETLVAGTGTLYVSSQVAGIVVIRAYNGNAPASATWDEVIAKIEGTTISLSYVGITASWTDAVVGTLFAGETRVGFYNSGYSLYDDFRVEDNS